MEREKTTKIGDKEQMKNKENKGERKPKTLASVDY